MRKEALKKALNITRLQIQAINEENIERFEELLEERQIQIDLISEINKQDKKSLDEEEKQLLETIRKEDEELNCKYIELFEQTKSKLREIRSAKNKTDYYNNPYSTYQEEGMFIDKRGR